MTWRRRWWSNLDREGVHRVLSQLRFVHSVVDVGYTG
jgi:hypothetical protein